MIDRSKYQTFLSSRKGFRKKYRLRKGDFYLIWKWSINKGSGSINSHIHNGVISVAICRTPLSRRYVPDVIVWLHDKNGVCSEKSSYHIARLLLKEAGCEGESLALLSRCYVWAKIWKLHVPNKINVFGWQAWQNILPTWVYLAWRWIIEDDSCNICQRHSESMLHAFWEWNGSGCVG